MRRYFLFAAILAVFLTACGELPAVDVAPEEGAQAPDFELQTLSGESLRLSDLRGQPLLINFWATWCAPCRTEMPTLQQYYAEKGLQVLAVNFDEPSDQVQAFADELGLTFPILLDPGATVQELYRVRGYPSSFFVDEQGIIVAVHIGSMTDTQLEDYLARMGALN